jgi:hypothetical protein
MEKKISKVPYGMKKLPTKPKVEKPNKSWHWDERPTIHVDDKELPSIKEMKVGSEIMLCIKVRVERVEDSLNHETGKTKASAALRVTEIGVMDEMEKEEEEQEDND